MLLEGSEGGRDWTLKGNEKGIKLGRRRKEIKEGRKEGKKEQRKREGGERTGRKVIK